MFQIVENSQVNLLENKVPPDNPMARVLLGAGAGDKVHFDAPKGRITFNVLDVGRV